MKAIKLIYCIILYILAMCINLPICIISRAVSFVICKLALIIARFDRFCLNSTDNLMRYINDKVDEIK